LRLNKDGAPAALRGGNSGEAISNLKFQISEEEKTDGDETLGELAG